MLISSYRMAPTILVASPEEEVKLVQEIEELKEKKESVLTNPILKNKLHMSEGGRPSTAPGHSSKMVSFLDVKRTNSDGDLIATENMR